MKLSEWAKMQGISYLTAYRWFKNNKFPVTAYQSDSGTIIVEENEVKGSEEIVSNQSNDVMSLLLKKTVEFSKNNASIEDFAAYIISNFSLKPNSGSDHPRYSRNKPKSEDIQKHFQQFLKPQSQKPKPTMFVADPEEFSELSDDVIEKSLITGPIVEDLIKSQDSILKLNNELKKMKESSESSIVDCGVLELSKEPMTSQQIISDGYVIVRSDFVTTNVVDEPKSSSLNTAFIAPSTIFVPAETLEGFKPSQEEINLAREAIGKMASDLHNLVVKSRRGRKPKK